MPRRVLVRGRQDSNSIWDDISIGEKNDTFRWFRRSVSRWAFWLVTVVIAGAIGAAGVLLFGLAESQPNVPDVVAKAKASIFQVYCDGPSGTMAGTGVAVTMPLPDKYETGIISAAHIFEECSEETEVKIKYRDKEYTGLLSRKDPAEGAVTFDDPNEADLALILMTEKFPTLDPAPKARQGDWAIAMGNPWDETNYATFGIVSDITIDTYLSDAAVNEGNSGGPLLDAKARVLGITSHGPIKADQYEPNPEGIYDRAEGIAVFQRLHLACERFFKGSNMCPFEN